MFLWRKKVDDAVLNEYIQRAESLRESRAFQEAKEYYEKAVKRCDELLESAPKSDYLRYRKARVLYELRRFEGPDWAYVKRCRKALMEIDEAIKLDPEDNGYHFLRCEILEELSKPPEWSLNASADEERIMDVQLFFFSLSHFVRGFIVDARGAPLKYLGDEDKPIDIRLIETKDDYEHCLEEHPNDPDCCNNLAAALHELGMWDMRADPKALEKLNKAIALNPGNPAYYSNRALVVYSLIMDALMFRRRERGWLKDKDPEKMLQDVFRDLGRAVEQDPRNPYYHYNMGLMLYEDEKYGEAGEELDKAIALDSSNHYFHYKKGMVLYRLGRYGEALESFKEALRLDEKDHASKYMIKLVERVMDRERGITQPMEEIIPEWVGDDMEDKVFLQPGGLQADEVLSRTRELVSIAQKFGLINPETPREELEKLEKWLSEDLSKQRVRLDSIMLDLCFYCPAYWFDTEMIYGPEDYVELVSNLSSITRGLLPLSGIECQAHRLPDKKEPEDYVLSFIASGEKYTVKLPFKGDWAQYGPIVRVLNGIMGKMGRRERYVHLNTMDQTAYLIFCIPENYEACKKAVAELLRCWLSPEES